MPDIAVLLFQLVVLILSVMIHEVSHGVVAEKLGDPTARLAGRLTLNPVKHLDFFGSFLFPLSLYILSGGAFVLGWAKPVPYDPRFLKNPRLAAGQIAAAGPLSNFLLAVVFGLIMRALPAMGFAVSSPFFLLLSFVVYINIMLGVFNLLPLPPLDGARVLYVFLPKTEAGYALTRFLETYGLFLFLLFFFFGFRFILPIIRLLYVVITGV